MAASDLKTRLKMDRLSRENAELRQYLLDVACDLERVIVRQDGEFDIEEMCVWCNQMKTLLAPEPGAVAPDDAKGGE